MTESERIVVAASDDASPASDVVLGAFPRNEREMVIAEVTEYKGRTYGHLRIAVPSAVADEWVRTGKGVAIPAEQLGDLARAMDELAAVASSDRVVAKLDAGREQLWIGVSRFRDETYLFVRRYYCKNGEWKPTRRGVNVKTEQYGELQALVQALVETCRRMPL